jgi:hypothetical protein
MSHLMNKLAHYADDQKIELDEIVLMLAEVIGKHRGLLVATATRHLDGDRELAQDVVQDVCVDAIEGRLELAFNHEQALRVLVAEVIARAEAA